MFFSVRTKNWRWSLRMGFLDPKLQLQARVAGCSSPAGLWLLVNLKLFNILTDPVWPADTTSMEGPLEEGGMLQP